MRGVSLAGSSHHHQRQTEGFIMRKSKQQKVAEAYFMGQRDKWFFLKHRDHAGNPWGKPCPEGWAYMDGHSDFPDIWDTKLGGREIPDSILLWREKYAALQERQRVLRERKAVDIIHV
jgi:hypothetical protein